MKIEEYMESLPKNIMSGEGASLSERTLRDIFRLVELNDGDVFYHLGCGNENGVSIAIQEFGVKKAVGIDNDSKKIKMAEDAVRKDGLCGSFLCMDVRMTDITDATVILFWFTEDDIIDVMMKKFKELKPGTRIVTLWGPLPQCLPHNVEFPYIVNKVPFKKSASMQEQMLAVMGVKCIDFVTAWEFAERYTKAVAGPEIHNDRFLTIIMTLIIWINAREMGAVCENDIPESIKTYVNIMHEHFGIDFGHLLEE